MARLSLLILAVMIELSRGNRVESKDEQKAVQLASDQDADPSESPYYYRQKPGWENTANDDVKRLSSVQPEMRQIFVPVKEWTEVASLSIHMMIATSMLENLKNATHVVDIGSGTGALLAVFAELVPKSAVLEGLEYMTEVADAARQKMEEASLLFKKNGNDTAETVAKKISQTGIAGGEDGDLFNFNLKGERDGEFDVINVGFAMSENQIPGALWKALAVNGKLGMPICDGASSASSSVTKCPCHYHIFTKNSEEAEFPGTKLEGSEHMRIENDIHFMVVRPPLKFTERVACPGGYSGCDQFSEQVPLPKDGARFVEKVLSSSWTDQATTIQGSDTDWIHVKSWQEEIEVSSWGLTVVYVLDCEEGDTVMTWTFTGLGDLQSIGTRRISQHKGKQGDCIG
jgi:protein-L-isoaspartate O-methyltransferase